MEDCHGHLGNDGVALILDYQFLFSLMVRISRQPSGDVIVLRNSRKEKLQKNIREFLPIKHLKVGDDNNKLLLQSCVVCS